MRKIPDIFVIINEADHRRQAVYYTTREARANLASTRLFKPKTTLRYINWQKSFDFKGLIISKKRSCLIEMAVVNPER